MIALYLPSKCGNWKENEERLPFPGNFNEARLRREQKHSITKAIVWTRLYLVLLHVLTIGLLWVLYHSVKFEMTHPMSTIGRTWSPAQHIIEYELNGKHTTNHSHYSKYSGPPSDEQDEAWDDLLRPVYFNASLEEVVKSEETVRDDMVAVVEGGYLANLAVYHELHCVRQLRFWLYKDRYYPDLTDAGDKYQRNHLDHCLETLRLSIMCNANTALYTFYWEDATDLQPSTKSNSRSVCVKWEPLEKWAYNRKISTSPKFNKTLGFTI
ncbi:hypothetical protein NUW58_g2547 [Xylaria curta]|uniref:Uncharacterized protein n=1 Tax=Xylaria curta TaxID=42375 RepID=A0ACC1PHQ4_9PEZI|nr:hypothetical protein NUW58_g2547 [Xylaria curta]